MSPMTSSEWDDIPTSSELFGGDFFGDELMEMYSADTGLIDNNSTSIITTATAEASHRGEEPDDVRRGQAPCDDNDDDHPGLLIAMNAAAMDGGLSPLGSDPEFAVPMTAPSSDGADAGGVDSLPPYPVVTPTAAPAPTPEVAVAPLQPDPAPVAAAAVPTPVTSATAVANKRPAGAAPVLAQVTVKKRKGMIAAPAAAAPAAVPQVKTAAPPPAVDVAANGVASLVPPSLGRVVSSASVLPQAKPPTPTATATAAVSLPGTLRAPVAAPMAVLPAMPKKTAHSVAQPRTAFVPKAKVTQVGGISHQVVARPAAVPSSAAVVAPRGILAPVQTQTAAARANAARMVIPAKKPAIAAPAPPVPSTATLSAACPIRAKSEVDFKDVASAAVSSLIQNASSTLVKAAPKPPVGLSPAPRPSDTAASKLVDTSTAHINALTSQNWVTACNPIPSPDPILPPSSAASAASAAAACDKAARNARRAALTQEERAKQNRDRNREHARNTRLRKKAYVEELKRTLTELVAQRDAADLEKRHSEQRNREQREVRFRVMEEFLKLRGRNEPNAARWVAILEDGFTLTLPRTTYRRMVDSTTDVNGGCTAGSSVEQVMRGAVAAMEDSQHLSAFLQSVGGPPSVTQVQIVYVCERKRFFMDGNIAFMDFDASTLGAVAKGASDEVNLKGSMRAAFSPASNKLISVDIVFDTGAFVQQIEEMGNPAEDAAAAAAHEADALLDSLQMPQIFAERKEQGVGAMSASAAGAISVSSDDGERSTDGSASLLIR